MREWVSRHRMASYLCIVGAAVLAQIIVQVATRTGSPATVFTLLFYMVFGIGISYLTIRAQRKRQRSLASHGLIFAYLRYPGSPSGSLGDLWAGGSVSYSPGQIIFQELMNNTEVPLGKPIRLNVTSSFERRQPATKGQIVHLLPGTSVLTLTRLDGDVEIAADASALEKLQRDVFGANPFA